MRVSGVHTLLAVSAYGLGALAPAAGQDLPAPSRARLMEIPSDSVSYMAAGIIESADTGQPIAGAQVFLDRTMIGTVADRDGRFRLDATSPGPRRLRVRIIGYQEVCLNLVLREETMLSLRIALARPRVPTGDEPGEGEQPGEGSESGPDCLEPEIVPYPPPGGPGHPPR